MVIIACEKYIEKCSSPIGDGNVNAIGIQIIIECIEKCSSPIGDGNCLSVIFISSLFVIEKCSSPIGDGNGGVMIAMKPVSKN